MNQERLYQVIDIPHVSEKASRLGATDQQLVLRVRTDASKFEIMAAVQMLFSVRVKDVRTARIKGKSKRFGRLSGRRSDWKKAYVSLEPGQDIDLLGSD